MTITMKDFRFGIEIESVGLDVRGLAQALHGFEFSGGRRFNIVRDGSLPEPAGECVSPILTWDDIPRLQEALRIIRQAGSRATPACGIHVHVDGTRHFTPRALANLAKMYNKQEELLYKALKVHPNRLRYCQRLSESFIQRLDRRPITDRDQMNEAWYGRRNNYADRYDGSRYHGLNLNSYFYRGTIEWRLFNGTLHAGEVKAYVHLCLAMAAKACTSKSAVSKKRETSDATAKYDMRVFLLRLGMIGDEFESTRHHLLKHLTGNSAFRGAAPASLAVQPALDEPQRDDVPDATPRHYYQDVRVITGVDLAARSSEPTEACPDCLYHNGNHAPWCGIEALCECGHRRGGHNGACTARRCVCHRYRPRTVVGHRAATAAGVFPRAEVVPPVCRRCRHAHHDHTTHSSHYCLAIGCTCEHYIADPTPTPEQREADRRRVEAARERMSRPGPGPTVMPPVPPPVPQPWEQSVVAERLNDEPVLYRREMLGEFVVEEIVECTCGHRHQRRGGTLVQICTHRGCDCREYFAAPPERFEVRIEPRMTAPVRPAPVPVESSVGTRDVVFPNTVGVASTDAEAGETVQVAHSTYVASYTAAARIRRGDPVRMMDDGRVFAVPRTRVNGEVRRNNG